MIHSKKLVHYSTETYLKLTSNCVGEVVHSVKFKLQNRPQGIDTYSKGEGFKIYKKEVINQRR